MTDDRMALMEALQKADDGNFLRSLAETVLQILMEADVEGMIGAGRYERSGERSTWRNGYRDRTLDTWLGQLNLRIPKLRTGSYFPPFLEARKTTEKALVSVIQGEPASRHRFETAGERDRRGFDAESRRSRAGHGAKRDQQEPGLEAVQGDRRTGRRLPQAAAGGRLALPLARRDLPQGPGGWPARRALIGSNSSTGRNRPGLPGPPHKRLGRRHNRHGGEHRRPP